MNASTSFCTSCQGSLTSEASSLCESCAAALGTMVLQGFRAEGSPALQERSGAGYELRALLGRGAQGEVWLAHDAATGRDLAVKILLRRAAAADAAAESRLLWRFQREVEAVAGLGHPGIVRVLHSGATTDGRPWYAMEKIEGMQLDAWVREGNPPRRRRLEVFVRICEAMHHAHQRGVIHRDLKPANIMMEAASGQPKIVDFGLARFTESLHAGGTLTLDGQTMGTPMFMAPEQARGESAAVGTASDTYALGAILFTLLSSALPYDSRLTTFELLEAIRTRPPLPLRAVEPDAPRDLEAIVDRAMAREPERRYHSVAALSEDVQRFLDGYPVEARRGSRLYFIRKTLRRHWKAAAAIALLLAAAVGAGLWHWREIARRNEVAGKAYGEAGSLLAYLLTDTSDRLREVGRNDVNEHIARRAADFPWDLPVEDKDRYLEAWSVPLAQARIAFLRGEAAEKANTPAAALEFYESAATAARAAILLPHALAATSLHCMEYRAAALRMQARVHPSPATAAAILTWLDESVPYATHGVSRADAAAAQARLLRDTLPLLVKHGREPAMRHFTAVQASIIRHREKHPDAVALIHLHAELAETGARLAAAESSPLAAAELAVKATTAWEIGLERNRYHTGYNEGRIRCLVLEAEARRKIPDLTAALSAWERANHAIRLLSDNFIRAGGHELEEAAFRACPPLAAALLAAGRHEEARRICSQNIYLVDILTRTLPPSRIATPKEKPGKPVTNKMIPDLWSVVADWYLTEARATLAGGDLELSFTRYIGTSRTLHELSELHPDQPRWLLQRCAALVEWCRFPPFDHPQYPRPAMIRRARELIAEASALKITAEERATLEELLRQLPPP